MKQSKKQLRRRIKELEASNRILANINQNFCLEMAALKSANRALQATANNLKNIYYDPFNKPTTGRKLK